MKSYWDLTPGQRAEVDADPKVAAALADTTAACALADATAAAALAAALEAAALDAALDAAAIDAAGIDALDAARNEVIKRMFGKEN